MVDDRLSAELAGLAELHRTGALSDEEFSAAKARVLQGDRAASPQDTSPGPTAIPPAPYIPPAPPPQPYPPQSQFAPGPMYAPAQSWPPGAALPPLAGSATTGMSGAVPAIGMLVAGGGLIAAIVFRYSTFAGGFFDTNSDWWDQSNIIFAIDAAVLIACGVAMLTRPRSLPCAIALAPAAMLGVEFVALTGESWDLLSDGSAGAGWWGIAIGAGACVLVVISGTTWVVRDRWPRSQAASSALPLLVALAAAALAAAGALMPRYSFDGEDVGGVFANSPEGWGVFFALGVLGVSVVAPLWAAALYRSGRGSALALGAALAVITWDGPSMSRVIFGESSADTAAGFPVLLCGMVACLVLALILYEPAQPRSAMPPPAVH